MGSTETHDVRYSNLSGTVCPDPAYDATEIKGQGHQREALETLLKDRKRNSV